VLRVRRNPDIGQQGVPIWLASRYCHQQGAHVGKRLDSVPLGTSQNKKQKKTKKTCIVT
jgi:hypothetical protein